MNVIDIGYYTHWEYDYHIDYSNLFLLQQDRLLLVINDPNQNTWIDLFFILDSDSKSIIDTYTEGYTNSLNR